MNELKSITGVEVFAAGTWNGDTYSTDDLDEMVRAYSDTRKKVPLKLGHPDKQGLLQKEGWPAAGWLTNLRRQGSKLVADFVDLPEKIYELIRRKAYRNVSSEVFWNANYGGKNYKRMLSAVALLGGEMPAVSCLDDVLALYGVTDVSEIKAYYAVTQDDPESRSYTAITTEDKPMPKTETEIKLEYDLKAEKERADAETAKVKKYEADLAARDKAAKEQDAEIAELKKFKQEAQARAEADAERARVAEEEKFLTDLKSEKLITPAMKPYVQALVGAEKKEYSLQVEGKEKKFSKQQLLRETLKLFSAASSVNFEESSEEGDKGSKTDASAINKEIEKYALENKVSYKDAYKKVVSDRERKSA